MKYVIGIDAGGTFFRVKAMDLAGAEKGVYITTSLGYYSQDKELFLRGLKESIYNCISQFKGEIEECVSIVAGVSGIDSEDDRLSLEKDIRSITGCSLSVCMNDAELANEGINNGCGILLNSGTGSIVFGTNRDGYKCRVGGWPLSIFGDEGSGAWIALKTLRLYASWIDGLVESSLLIKYLQEEFSLNSTKAFMDLVLSLNSPKSARIAPLVDKAEQNGDKNARSILDEAANESFSLVNHIAHKLGYSAEDEFYVGIWGSNILCSKRHLSRFTAILKENFPNAVIRTSDESLLDFSVKEALKVSQKERE